MCYNARAPGPPARIVVALVILLCAGTAAAAAGAHERACGAAFRVLRHCAAAGSREDVRARCCGLLDAFHHNGCLCPDCPPGASSDATSSQGLLLGAELSPLTDLCGSQLMFQATQLGGREQVEGEDEDDLAADMAGLAAAAQDPQRAQQLVQRAAAAVSARAAALAQEQQVQEEGEEGEEMMDTLEGDYDNLLSDADAAFMLVDPSVARTYAARAAQLAHDVAADVASRLAAGRAVAAEVEGEIQARFEALLAGRGAGSVDASSSSDVGAGAVDGGEGKLPMQQLQEAVASAGAVGDESAVEASEAPAGHGRPALLLARADAVPQTAQQRRADALAAAMEGQQEQHMVLQQAEQEGRDVEKISLDITIDSDNPEAARRLAGSLAALLRSWQAAGSASTQAELAAALESAAAKVAAAASASGALGRAGLQPRQLLLQQVEEAGRHPGKMCACMDAELPADGPASLAAAAYRRYVGLRLVLCRFACQHQQTLAMLLLGELALCATWLAIWLLRARNSAALHSADSREAGRQHQGQHSQQQPQFLIASAADPQWHPTAGELREPLLGPGDTAGSSTWSTC